MHFNADFFTRNRQRLARAVNGGCIVMCAHAQLQRTGDTTYPFRQESNFWYLTGIQEPGIWLIIDTDSDQEFLVLPKRAVHQDVWDGELNQDQLIKISGISVILSYDEGCQKIRELTRYSNRVHTIVIENNYLENHAMYLNPAKAELCRMLRSVGLELKDIRPHLSRQRMIKQPVEQQAIQESINLTVSGFKHFIEHSNDYTNETEIQHLFDAFFAKHGAEHAYQPIIASGRNAATIHYIKNSAKLERNNFLLLDIGAEKNMYAADITRMYFIGEPTNEQQKYYSILQDVQRYAISLVKPGEYIKDIDQRAARHMCELLKEAKLLSKNTTNEELRDTLYPHALSHFLGLDTHDSGIYTEPLTEGMIITVEPGIYVPEKRLGLRIEDNILVTSIGQKNLSEALPRELFTFS